MNAGVSVMNEIRFLETGTFHLSISADNMYVSQDPVMMKLMNS